MKTLAVPMALTVAMSFAAPAEAAPDCNDIGVSTRLCTRSPGHTAIITSPDPAFTDPGPGWGFGTLDIPVMGPGGGFWVGF